MRYSPVGVWTKNEDPEWLRKNAGNSEMLLIECPDQEAAWAAEIRLREKYKDPDLFTRAV